MANPQTQHKLPVIDLTQEITSPGGAKSATCGDVRRALEEYGCFAAVYDKVPAEVEDRMFRQLEGLFGLPKEAKSHVPPNMGPVYFGPSPNNPLFECFLLLNGTKPQETNNFVHRLWPAGNHTFRESVVSVSKLLSEVYQIVERMVLESYGAEKSYEEEEESDNGSSHCLGFSKYGAPYTDEINTEKALPHTDKCFLSITYQNHVRTFGIKAKDGQWIAFQPAPSTFLVIAGEAFKGWSNGRIHSPAHSHGVMMTGKEASYSVFLDLNSLDLPTLH